MRVTANGITSRNIRAEKRPSWRARIVVLIACIALGSASTILPADAAHGDPVTIQLLSVSDWHAQLDPISVGSTRVGGAAVLSSYFKAERAANPNTLTLTGGDAFGGSPPLSGFFEEEPAVRAMNLMGFDADTFGNHNFDRGLGHLQRMVDLAEFDYVSANLKNLEANLTGVAPYALYTVGGLKVAVIGITNADAAILTRAGSLGTIEVTDPAEAAMKARAAALKQGAQLFVAIAHLGVTAVDPATGQGSGPLIDFAEQVGGFDVILGDHTNREFSGVINKALVVENRSNGVTYARSTLQVDPLKGRVISRSVQFVSPVASAVTPDPAIEEMLAPYRSQLAAVYDTKIGEATDVFPRGSNIERMREVALGNLVADSMRLRYGAQLALTNGGGLRSPLPSGYLAADRSLRRTTSGYAAGPPYDLVVGDAFAVLPFGNEAVTRTITGAQLWAVLEHSVARMPAADGRFPQISGFRFTFDQRLPAGMRVISVALDDGTPISPDDTVYTFVTNDFVNDGGDGYTMLKDGQGVTREITADVLLDYIKSKGSVTPTIEGRITNLGA
ncbi:MAG TPA: 5'-nucleotidase C-terminal domain-containing protein [Actinomycetota bacterium]|nr:5'-nucleotidase C-terminal domain-containing protein [Actinomycetota bacterium]